MTIPVKYIPLWCLGFLIGFMAAMCEYKPRVTDDGLTPVNRRQM